MTVDFLRDQILLFGPGFVFAKLVYLFGEQHRRLEWEWLVWSLVASLPIAFSAQWISTGVWPSAIPAAGDPAQAIPRFGIAIASAVVIATIWRSVRHWSIWPIRFVRRSLADSAWDLILDEAHHQGCGIAVTVKRIDDDGVERERSYYGTLAAFGYETADAEPIVYLKDVRRSEPGAGYVRLPGDDAGRDGMIFHRDGILRMRLVAPPLVFGRIARLRQALDRARARVSSWLRAQANRVKTAIRSRL